MRVLKFIIVVAALSGLKLAQAANSFRSLPESNLVIFLRKAFQQELSSKMKFPASDFEVHFESLQVLPAIKNEMSLQSPQSRFLGFGSAGARRPQGLFNLSLILADGSEHNVSGVAKVFGPVAVVKNNLTRGHVISSDDIQIVKMSWKSLVASAVALATDNIIGRRVKLFVSQGEAFSSDVLDEAVAVRVGEMISLTVLAGPGVIVHSRAIAKQEGRVGDFIRLEQPDTKKILTGQITAAKSAELRL